MFYPVILTGGVGKRLWPLSSSVLPKAFLPLLSDKSMIQETLLRFRIFETAEKPIIAANIAQHAMIEEQLRQIQMKGHHVIFEPCHRNTAPAVASIAIRLLQEDPEAVMFICPSDHAIFHLEKWYQSVIAGLTYANQGYIVTFGMPVSSPHQGYGYICKGHPVSDEPNIYAVSQFVEKPDESTAQTLLDSGDVFWNSGMYLCQAKTLLSELRAFCPDIVEACQKAVDEGYAEKDTYFLQEEAYVACREISIDYAVMEHTRHAVVVASQFGWQDVGSWKAVWSLQPKDDQGNVLRGDVIIDGVKSSYIHISHGAAMVIDVHNLIVINTPEALLITSMEKENQVKSMMNQLNQHNHADNLRGCTL